MIIELFMTAMYTVFEFLTSWIEIPNLSSEVYEYITTFFSYLSMGLGIFSNYAPAEYIMILFSIVLAVDVGIMVYHLVMWIIRKIPFAGME